MEPTSLLLLLSLLAGVGTAGYVGATANDRAYRVSRGATGAVRAGWTSGRQTATSSFSRPPARPAAGSTSFGADVGWGLRQLWHGLRVGASFFGGTWRGYAPAATAATARRAARTPVRDRLRALGRRTGAQLTFADVLRERLRRAVGDQVVPPVEPGRVPDARVGPPPSPTGPAPSGQNGAPMSALADVPGLAVVQEFPSPDAMREPLDDLAQLNGRMAEGMRALVEGLYEFVNAYAEAKFSTEALTQAVGAMVEAINDDGQINILTLAELIPPVADAVDEATGFGEHGKSVNAEGDVQAFTGH